MISSTPLLAAALSLVSTAWTLPAPQHHGRCYYPGWDGIKYMFIFGDSYSRTGFNETTGPQPSPGDPLGNPDYPGITSSNGPNWVYFLTTTFNETLTETVNFAYSGATLDSTLVAQYLSTVPSVQQQIDIEYIPEYSTKPDFLPWESNDTLFGIFIGINDIINSYTAQNASLNALIFDVYAGLVDQLYQTGARNFLFLNVPPINRAPQITVLGRSNETLVAEEIADWNDRVTALSANLTRTYRDTTSFLFDTNAIFNQVLDDPCSHPETCPYKNTTDYCPAYENGTPSWFSFNDTCQFPVDEYFWLNTLHPTFRMHYVTAQAVAGELSSKSPCWGYWG